MLVPADIIPLMDNALLTVLAVSPFVMAVLLANMAEGRPNVRILHIVYLVLLNSILMLFGVSSVVLGVLRARGALEQLSASLPNIDWAGGGLELLIGPALALVLLLPNSRRLAARVLAIDPKSIVHATALSMTATAISLNLFNMIISSYLLTPQGLQQAQQSGASATYLDILIFPLLTLFITALFSVGWLTRRSWPDVVERLGLTVPTLPQLGLAIIAVVVLLGLSIGTDSLWAVVDPAGQKQVGGVSAALLGNFTGLSGAFAVGITAAIGEETFFRGAYLPRMGVLLSALLFASFHTQYFLSFATLLVFVIGLVLGVLRQRTNLTVCITVHFLYNFVSVLLGS
jgi:uncharacterized protein